MQQLTSYTNNQNASSFQTNNSFAIIALVDAGDYFTFYIDITSGSSQSLIAAGLEIQFKEF